MHDIIQYTLFGLVTGSTLAIASAGFAMIRQTEGFLHLAHGQYLALGAFLGFVLVSDLGLPLPLGVLVTALIVGLVGCGLAIVVFRPIQSKGIVVLLFSSIGLAYVVYAFMIAVFGPALRTYPVDFGHRFDVLESVSITVLEIAIIVFALMTVIGLHVFLTMTQLGKSIRAVASNSELALVRGVSVRRVSLTVWFIASALAGVAGVLMGALSTVTLELGWIAMLLILAATVIGGLGRIYGVMAAALLLGLTMDLSSLVIPTTYRTAVAFGVLVLVLLIRPQGIFSIKTRREQVA